MLRFQLTTLTLIAGLSFQVHAQLNAKDGITKLKTNVEMSNINLTETEKALKATDANVIIIAKAKNQSEVQRTEVKKAIQENNKYLQTLDKHETDLTGLIRDEKKDMEAEQKKLLELENAVAVLKTNQHKRTANIHSYEDQLKQIQKERTDWKARGEELNKTQVKTDKQIENFASTESAWKEKQKKAQSEVSDWQKKTERNQKLYEQYVTISEIKE